MRKRIFIALSVFLFSLGMVQAAPVLNQDFIIGGVPQQEISATGGALAAIQEKAITEQIKNTGFLPDWSVSWLPQQQFFKLAGLNSWVGKASSHTLPEPVAMLFLGVSMVSIAVVTRKKMEK